MFLVCYLIWRLRFLFFCLLFFGVFELLFDKKRKMTARCSEPEFPPWRCWSWLWAVGCGKWQVGVGVWKIGKALPKAPRGQGSTSYQLSAINCLSIGPELGLRPPTGLKQSRSAQQANSTWFFFYSVAVLASEVST
jgi:hypothetical protein